MSALQEHLEEHLTEESFSPEEIDQIRTAAETGAIQYSDDAPGSRDFSRSDPDPPPPPKPRETRREPEPEPPSRDNRHPAMARWQDEWALDVRDYEMHRPDIFDALKHFEASRRAELSALNGPYAVEATLSEEITRIIEHARERGENAAEYFYGLAKARGYGRK